MTQAEAHYRKMTETPVERLIASLAVPTIISMLITNIYNLADTYFVASIHVSAGGAVGIVFTLMSILQAVGFMYGHGSGSVISRKLADRDTDAASTYASTSVFMCLITGAIFMIAGIAALTPLMRVMGSTETILPYARVYAICVLATAPLLIASLAMNNILRYEGKAFYGMIGLGLGGVLNMIGDPILIYGFHMGILGAGLSTAISQTISFIVLLVIFKKKAQSRIELKFFGGFRVIADIITTGLPNLTRQGLMAISSGLLNNFAGLYGDACITALAITTRCTGFMISVALGICQGFQPVAGFNYQARKYRRLRDAFRFTMIASAILLAAFGAVGLLFAPQIVALFQKDPEVLAIGPAAMRWGSGMLVFVALNLSPGMLFQTCGFKKSALFLALLRGGLSFIPIILILAPLLGLDGVRMAQPMADMVTGLISLPFTISFFKQLPREDMA